MPMTPDGDAHEGELAWFRRQLGRALWDPREFARALPLEHFGIASVLAALLAGFALSLAIDVLVLASRGFDPLAFLSRLLLDGIALALRLAVTAAIVAALGYAGKWLASRRRSAVSLEQLFTAFAFGLFPLILLAPLAALLALVPESLPLTGPLLALVLVRTLAGVALNVGALLSLPLAALVLALALGSGWLTLQDQVARARAVTFAYVPALAAPLPATAPAGARTEGDSWSIVMPARWTNATRGVTGEAARFETDTDTLVVSRVRNSPLLTAEEFADRVGTVERRGLSGERTDRTVWRNAGLILIDDRTRARYEGRPVLLRIITAVNGGQVMSLVFRTLDPADEAALSAEQSAIAAGWRISAER